MQIIVPHTNADFDALGAAVAASLLYPSAYIVLPGTTGSAVQDFLALHRYHLPIKSLRDLDLKRVTRVIAVDTTDPSRLGPIGELVGQVEFHLYDHHPRDAGGLTGALEVWEPVGACCTLFAELLEEAGISLTPFQATAILLGLYSDTGSLTLAGTTARDAQAAAFLLAQGASLRALNQFLTGNLSPVQQAVLKQLVASGTWVTVKGARIRLVTCETPEYINGLSLIVHRLLEVEPMPALFAVARMGERVYIVARSEVPWVNADRILERFDGGGHHSAASAVVKGEPLDAVVQRLQEALTELVEPPVLARTVMTAPVKSIRPDMSVQEAERLMLRYGHTGMPVIDPEGKLVGIVSLRDTEKAIRHGLGHAPVTGVMTRRVETVTPDTPADEVQERMIDLAIGRLPVVEDGVLVGIITRSNLLTLIYGGPPPGRHRTLYTGPQAGALASVAENLASVAMRTMPLHVQHLLQLAGRIGADLATPVYVVGGFVRDLLLGRPNLDIDLVVEGDGIAYARQLGEALGARVEVVERFGTAHLFLAEGAIDRIDVATARREFYEHAAALPLVEHADLREDLYRRDFSFNAMALALTPTGPAGLVDFFGGWQDLQAGQVRILHTLSFVEDPTRIFRAARFACRYGFHLEPETEACARRAIADGLLERLSPERVRNEMVAIFQEAAAHKMLGLLHRIGALERVLPGFAWDHELAAIMAGARRLPSDFAEAGQTWFIRLLLLLHRVGATEVTELAGRLKLRREESTALMLAHSGWQDALGRLASPGLRPSGAVEVLRSFPPEGVAMLWLLSPKPVKRRIEAYWRKWRHVRLTIGGEDLIQAGAAPGPAIGRTLSRVLEARLDGAVSGREAELALALAVLGHEQA